MPFDPQPAQPGRPVACVGIDPSARALGAWGLPDDASGALAFGRTLIEAARGGCPVIKPQVAYFERFGGAGLDALATLIAEARGAGLLVVADAKRADIGPTMAAYASAWLGEGAPMRADALTVVPYLGLGSLAPVLDAAFEAGAYVFVVVRSSNPEGGAVQEHGEPPLWQRLLEEMDALGTRYEPGFPGAVIGATRPDDLRTATEMSPRARLLVPGLGAQGGRMEDVMALPASARERLVVNASRSIAAHGPDVARLRAAIGAMLDA